MKTSKGFTLTEVLVGVVVGVIAIAAAFSAYNYYAKSYTSVAQKANTNKAARDALIIITKDLRNAGYIDPNFINNSTEGISSQRQAELKLIEVRNRHTGKYRQADTLGIWYTVSPKDRKRIFYRVMKYQNQNEYFLARDVVLNPEGGNNNKTLFDNELLVPYLVDFQVVLKDKDGDILMPVCFYCGSVENSQGAGVLVSTSVGNKTRGQDNMKKVHTADVYLTVRTPKAIYKTNRTVNMKSGEGTYGSNITVQDKFHQETFFASVHTRNLAIPTVQISSNVGSLGVGQGYNK